MDIRAESVILGFEYIDTMQEQVIAIDWGSTKLVSEWVFGPIGDLAVWMETATCCLSHIFLDKTKIHIQITDMLKSFISQNLANYISLKGGGDDDDYSPLQSKACLTFNFFWHLCEYFKSGPILIKHWWLKRQNQTKKTAESESANKQNRVQQSQLWLLALG